MSALQAFWVGRIDVLSTEELFDNIFTKRKRSRCSDTLLLLEHPPTFTYNTLRGEHDFSAIRNELWFDFYCAQYNVAVIPTDRGGGMMYHGPGQLIFAPIIELRRGFGIPEYVNLLEDTMVRFLDDNYGVSGFRIAYNREASQWRTESGESIDLFDGKFQSGTQGVWVHDKNEVRKIGFLGARLRQGIVTRGCALNLSPDLEAFTLIDPCDLPGVSVSSAERLSGIRSQITPDLARVAVEYFAEGFGYRDVVFADVLPRSFREK